jgi:hypothetical protein
VIRSPVYMAADSVRNQAITLEEPSKPSKWPLNDLWL